jgi:hypothetical protein
MKNIPILFLLVLHSLVYGEGKFQTENYNPLPSGNLNSSIFFSHGDQTYLAFTGPGARLFRFHGNWSEVVPSKDSIPSVNVHQIKRVNDATYFCTSKGFTKFNGVAYSTTAPSAENKLNSPEIYNLAGDEDYLAVVTSQGLSFKKHADQTWTNVSRTELGLNMFSPSRFEIDIEILNGLVYLSSLNEYIIYDIEDKSKNLYSLPKLDGLAKHKGKIYTFTSSPTSQLYILDPEPMSLSNQGVCGKIGTFWSSSAKFYSGANGLGIVISSYTETVFYTLTNQTLSARYSIPKSDPMDFLQFTVDQKDKKLIILNENQSISLTDFEDDEIFRKELAYLDINEFKTPISNRGLLNTDKFFSISSQVPKGECTSPLFSSSIWMAAKQGQDYHVAAVNYGQAGYDFYPGPLDPNDGSYDSMMFEKFNRVWKINKSEVQEHINYFKKQGYVLESQIPEAIWNWPGDRDGSVHIAPFVDQNKNGSYEPNLGDYPKVPGDQCIYWIMNDNGGLHEESGGLPLGVEIHGMAYAYVCSNPKNQEDEAVNYTTFFRYTVINQSNTDYEEVLFGKLVDGDLGNYSDDAVGCHVTENLAYVYNGDSLDEGPSGYGDFPPMLSVKTLSAPSYFDDKIDNDNDGLIDEMDERRFMGSFLYYDNDFTDYGNPQLPEHYYNYLNGVFKNDSCIKTPDNTCTKYHYSGGTDPDYSKNWTMQTSGLVPSDRRMAMGSFPFELDSKDTVVFEYAMIYSRDESQRNQLPKNLRYVEAIEEWYYSEETPECFFNLSADVRQLSGKLNVFPNPSIGEVTVQSSKNIQRIDVTDIHGRILISIRPNSKTHESILFLKDLQAGSYFLTVHDETGTYTKKISLYN